MSAVSRNDDDDDDDDDVVIVADTAGMPVGCS